MRFFYLILLTTIFYQQTFAQKNGDENQTSDCEKAQYYAETASKAENSDTALKYGLLALKYLKETDTLQLARAAYNVGKAYYMQDFNEIASFVKSNALNNDLVLTLGAGTVTEIKDLLVEHKED